MTDLDFDFTAPGNFFQPDYRPPLQILGFRLVVTHRIPKLQLSPDCPVSDEVRKETNAWMIKFFGMKDVIEDSMVMVDHNNRRAYVNALTFNNIKNRVPNTKLRFGVVGRAVKETP